METATGGSTMGRRQAAGSTQSLMEAACRLGESRGGRKGRRASRDSMVLGDGRIQGVVTGRELVEGTKQTPNEVGGQDP